MTDSDTKKCSHKLDALSCYFDENLGIYDHAKELSHLKSRRVRVVSKTDDLPLDEILARFPAEKYGWGDMMRNKVHYHPLFGLSIDLTPRVDGRWDCYGAAIGVSEMLSDYEPRVMQGRDEQGIFSQHYYVLLADGRIIDPTPISSLVGADHLPLKAFPVRAQEGRIPLGVLPLSYIKENDITYLTLLGVSSPERLDDRITLTREGINYDHSKVDVAYIVCKFVSGEAHFIYQKTFSIMKKPASFVTKKIFESGLDGAIDAGYATVVSQGFDFLNFMHGISEWRENSDLSPDEFEQLYLRDEETVRTFSANVVSAFSSRGFEKF